MTFYIPRTRNSVTPPLPCSKLVVFMRCNQKWPVGHFPSPRDRRYASCSTKRNTHLAELKTQVKHKTLHKVTALGALWRKMVVNWTKKRACASRGWKQPIHWLDCQRPSGISELYSCGKKGDCACMYPAWKKPTLEYPLNPFSQRRAGAVSASRKPFLPSLIGCFLSNKKRGMRTKLL